MDNLQIIIEPGTYQETGSITWNYQNLILFGNSTIPEDVRLNCISTSNSFLTIYSSFSISNITFSQCGQIISTSKQYTIYSISIDNCVFENNSNSYPNYLISVFHINKSFIELTLFFFSSIMWNFLPKQLQYRIPYSVQIMVLFCILIIV